MKIKNELIKKVSDIKENLSGSLAMLFILAIFFANPANAANGLLYASGITAPGGQVWMGSHLWVSDHGLGFCRLDPVLPGPGGNFSINPVTCIIGDGITGPASPGQPSFDPVLNFVYVPDNSNKGTGAWRLTFDNTTETVSTPVLLNTTGIPLFANPTATALDPAGNLYIGFIQNSTIFKISTPNLPSQNVSVFGTTSTPGVRKGVSGLAFAGNDLYLAEGAAVTKIGPAGGKAAAVTGIIGDPLAGLGPTAITSDGNNTVFFADTPLANGVSTIKRYTVSTNTQEIYSTTGIFPDLRPTPFFFVAGLALDPTGNLFTGDDITAGAGIGQGRIWKASITGVSLAVDNASRSTAVNANATYVLTISNTGTDTGTFDIVAQNPQNAVVSISNSAITLNGHASGTVLLNVTSAAPGSFAVSVTAVLQSNASVNSTINTTTAVSAIVTHGVSLTVDNTSKSISKSTGGFITATYVLTVTNTGNIVDTFHLTPDGICLIPEFCASLSQNNITLGAGTSGTVLLNVSSLNPGRFIINATATSLADAGVNATVTTTTIIVGLGDVNNDGSLDITDALFIAQETVGLRNFNAAQLSAADVNADGRVDIVDALFIAQLTVGLRVLV